MRKTQVEFTFIQRGWTQLPIAQLLDLLPQLGHEIGSVREFKDTKEPDILIFLAEVSPARAASKKSAGSTYLKQALRRSGLSESVTVISQVSYGRKPRHIGRKRPRATA